MSHKREGRVLSVKTSRGPIHPALEPGSARIVQPGAPAGQAAGSPPAAKGLYWA
jgi:hypothetical protein